MSRDLVITKCGIRGKDNSLFSAALYEDGKLTQLCAERPKDSFPIGTVFIGRTENAAANIGGGFVRAGERLFYMGGANIRPGREMPVQVTKEASGTKYACVTDKLSLRGRGAVVSEGKEGIAYSRKLEGAQKQRILALRKQMRTDGFHIMLRTNAAEMSDDEILTETERLKETLMSIRRNAPMRTLYSVLYHPMPFYAEFLETLHGGYPDRVITDEEEVYKYLWEHFSTAGRYTAQEINKRILMYGEEGYSLASAYNLRRDLLRLSSEKVYLRSGAYLIIERTEAFTAIDVNTGKCVTGKDPEETYRAINLEAAAESARQIRLRNLSGMILVDFINMKDAAHEAELLETMKNELRKDLRKAEAVDITKLGIMEIVRKKEGPLLAEVL